MKDKSSTLPTKTIKPVFISIKRESELASLRISIRKSDRFWKLGNCYRAKIKLIFPRFCRRVHSEWHVPRGDEAQTKATNGFRQDTRQWVHFDVLKTFLITRFPHLIKWISVVYFSTCFATTMITLVSRRELFEYAIQRRKKELSKRNVCSLRILTSTPKEKKKKQYNYSYSCFPPKRARRACLLRCRPRVASFYFFFRSAFFFPY